MPISTSAITLSNTTATLIVGADNMPHQVTLHNMTKSSNQYIHVGPSDMTLADSIHIDPGQTIQITLRPGDELYGMSDPNGLEVGVLDIQNND
jgi:hypothetical protein